MVAGAHRAVGPVDRNVDMEAERVVAPDDPAEDFVVSPVVRGVDDALLLPRAPGVRPGGAKEDAELVGERGQLVPALAHEDGSLREALAASGPDLYFRRNQLADEVVFELGPLRGGL
jgi:hypothetical protein